MIHPTRRNSRLNRSSKISSISKVRAESLPPETKPVAREFVRLRLASLPDFTPAREITPFFESRRRCPVSQPLRRDSDGWCPGARVDRGGTRHFFFKSNPSAVLKPPSQGQGHDHRNEHQIADGEFHRVALIPFYSLSPPATLSPHFVGRLLRIYRINCLRRLRWRGKQHD